MVARVGRITYFNSSFRPRMRPIFQLYKFLLHIRAILSFASRKSITGSLVSRPDGVSIAPADRRQPTQIEGISGMKTRVASLAMLATSVLALSAVSTAAAANEGAWLDKFPKRQAYHAATDKIVKGRKAGAQLSQWNGGFVDLHGISRHFVMVGPDPSSS